MKKRLISIAAMFLVLISIVPLTSCEKSLKEKSKNLTNYEINAELNDEKKMINADIEIDYINSTSADLETLKLNLHANAYSQKNLKNLVQQSDEAKVFPNGKNYGGISVSNLQVNGETVKTEFSDDEQILIIKLPEPLGKNQRIKIKMNFALKIPHIRHRFGYTKSAINLGNWYPIICSYQNGEFVECKSNINGDYFVSDCANYKVKLKVPEKYTVTGSGKSLLTDGIYNLENYSLRDFAIVIYKDFGQITESFGKTSISYFYINDDNPNETFATIKKAFKFFSEKFGAYPYETLSVCETEFSEGGMEYPALVYVSTNQTQDNYIFAMIHEIAHNWWYGVVGNNQLTEAFLDEGLTEFSTLLFKDYLGEPLKDNLAKYENVINNAKSIFESYNISFNLKMNRNIYEMKSSLEYVCSTYYKPCLMLNELMQLVGDEKFYCSLKNFYNSYKFKIAKFDDFIQIFSYDKKAQQFLKGYVNCA